MAPTSKEGEAESSSPVTVDAMISHFARSDPQMGLINNLFMRWADEFGASCVQCKELARIFATAVDQAKHGGTIELAKRLKRPSRSVSDQEPRNQNPALVQHKMVAAMMAEPHRSVTHQLVRCQGLNNRFRRVPRSARYFLVEISSCPADLHCMVKYQLWTSSCGDLLQKVAAAVDETGRGDLPSPTFGDSVFIIAYHETNTRGRKNFVGMAQITSGWHPAEWETSPFSFPHRGVLQARWVFCREFEYPAEQAPQSNSVRDLRRLSSGDELGKTTGDEIFRIFRDEPVNPFGRYESDPK